MNCCPGWKTEWPEGFVMMTNSVPTLFFGPLRFVPDLWTRLDAHPIPASLLFVSYPMQLASRWSLHSFLRHLSSVFLLFDWLLVLQSFRGHDQSRLCTTLLQCTNGDEGWNTFYLGHCNRLTFSFVHSTLSRFTQILDKASQSYPFRSIHMHMFLNSKIFLDDKGIKLSPLVKYLFLDVFLIHCVGKRPFRTVSSFE